MKPTDEQLAVCDSQADILKIKAGAGTGKTTTLVHLAARHPRDRILYLAFNKGIKEEAQQRFGRHVKAMTAHGLAFAHIGKHYANIPDKLAMSDLRPFHVLPELEGRLKAIPKELHNLYGGRVLETVKNFLVSGDEALDLPHVALGLSPGERRHFHADRLLADAQHIWTCMQDLRHRLPMIHDGYLKLFQLQQPDLGYDMVLLDEAQDTNPVTQALVEIQWGRLVYVGDEHQAIYGFRGARNAMALIQADEEHLLTGSFRFGPRVADVANAILEAKGEQALRLRGLGGPSAICPLTPGTPHAFISRGNSALFGRAVAALDKQHKFAFVGSLASYRLDLIEQTYHLMERMRQRVRDPFLASFESFDQLEEYADAMEDRDLKGRCKLVAKYAHRIPSLISRIQAQAGTYGQPGPFDLVLTTAHRAKGLEFDQVQMADDFQDFQDEETGEFLDLTQAGPQETEEINLQYVAATRARKRLEVGEKLLTFLRHQTKGSELGQMLGEAEGITKRFAGEHTPRPPRDPNAPPPANRPGGAKKHKPKRKAAVQDSFPDLPPVRRVRLPKPEAGGGFAPVQTPVCLPGQTPAAPMGRPARWTGSGT